MINCIHNLIHPTHTHIPATSHTHTFTATHSHTDTLTHFRRALRERKKQGGSGNERDCHGSLPLPGKIKNNNNIKHRDSHKL